MEKSVWTGIGRGLAVRCPNCGQGRLFRGYLSIRTPCESCGTDNTIYPSDDFPPYLTILAVAHIVVPLFVWSDRAYMPSMWLEAAIWLPVTLLLCLAILPRMKGAAVGLCWAKDMVRAEVAR
jgi:uncharacterized protein (DUF983 family)